jgi:hypothetical protein
MVAYGTNQPHYQRYEASDWSATNGTDPPVPFRWSVCERCPQLAEIDEAKANSEVSDRLLDR